MARQNKVPRPTKRSEYSIEFATVQASKGWRDLSATIRGPLADAWDFLTRTPLTATPTNYTLRGELGAIARDGKIFQRWQHKPTIKGDARIWFYVDQQTVYLEQVFTHHPNATK